jgi:hypothetical protein
MAAAALEAVAKVKILFPLSALLKKSRADAGMLEISATAGFVALWSWG